MTYVFDLDNTILYSTIDNNGEYSIVSVNIQLVKIINELYDNDHTIIIFTGRHWKHLEITREQLCNYNVKYTTLILGKPIADFYIDDLVLRPDEFLKEVLKNG